MILSSFMLISSNSLLGGALGAPRGPLRGALVKQSRHSTGLFDVGLKGTSVLMPHWPQTTLVSSNGPLRLSRSLPPEKPRSRPLGRSSNLGLPLGRSTKSLNLASFLGEASLESLRLPSLERSNLTMLLSNDYPFIRVSPPGFENESFKC